MSGETKQKSRKAAEAIIPLEAPDRELIISWFVKGYMTGHAAHTRWANKRHHEWVDVATKELKVVEREIGVQSKALKMIYQSSIKDANAPNG
jgi:hypothetical protein